MKEEEESPPLHAENCVQAARSLRGERLCFSQALPGSLPSLGPRHTRMVERLDESKAAAPNGADSKQVRSRAVPAHLAAGSAVTLTSVPNPCMRTCHRRGQPICLKLAAVVQAPGPVGKRLTGQTVRFASASTPGDTGTLSPQPLDALEKHLDSLETELSNGQGHEVRAKARQALQCLLDGNRRFCQVRSESCAGHIAT